MNKEEREKLKEAFESDLSNAQIAAMFSKPMVWIQTIRQWHRDEVNLPARLPGRPQGALGKVQSLDNVTAQLASAYEDDALSITQIAERFNLSWNKVQKQRRAYRQARGLPPITRLPKKGFE